MQIFVTYIGIITFTTKDASTKSLNKGNDEDLRTIAQGATQQERSITHNQTKSGWLPS